MWPEGREGGKLDQEGMRYAGLIADEMANPPADWLVMSRRYTTQSIDTSALEPDNANGWFDAETQTLHLVVPTQSPQEVADEMPRMLAKRNPPVKQLILHPCYTVGYGSKDHYNFPYYGAVAAMYGDGHPVRGQRPLRAVPDGAEAPRVRHELPHRGEPPDRRHAVVPR